MLAEMLASVKGVHDGYVATPSGQRRTVSADKIVISITEHDNNDKITTDIVRPTVSVAKVTMSRHAERPLGYWNEHEPGTYYTQAHREKNIIVALRFAMQCRICGHNPHWPVTLFPVSSK